MSQNCEYEQTGQNAKKSVDMKRVGKKICDKNTRICNMDLNMNNEYDVLYKSV